MRRLINIIVIISVSVLSFSCNNKPKYQDTLNSGAIDISVDETYKPIIEEQLKVFDSSNPEAKITVHYKPEAECFKDYFNQKAHLILVTRDLSKAEKEYCEQKKIFPSSMAVASDGIAVIVNNESKDTTLEMSALKDILRGNYKTKYTVVFDNSESSIVRAITDSVLKTDTLSKNVFAAKTSEDVIDYVSKNPNAIGFVGMSYVYVNEDTSRAGMFITNVKVVALHGNSAEYEKPYQAYIALKSYPLHRTLYYINGDSYLGLARGLSNFLATQRGQLIFNHSHFFPLRSNIVIRDADINNQ